MTEDLLLDVAGLDIAFRWGKERAKVVHGLGLAISPGECLALVGESGSGKSVTARALVGLAGDTAQVSAARMTVAGRDARALDERGWRRLRGAGVGFILQDALTALDPMRTVGAEVAEALRTHTAVPRAEISARIEELFRTAGIPDPERRRHQHAHELSGGLRQRALIATALAGGPRLLIADEPTTALDATVQRQILSLFAELKRAGHGLLLISHDLAVVAEVADRISVIDRGRVVESGPAPEILGAPAHGVTRALLDAVPRGMSGVRGMSGRSARRDVGARDSGSTPMLDVDPVLDVEDVVKRYRHRTALAGVSLTVRAGESVGIVGESGSGKSTLARIALGLLGCDSGAVRLDGQPWSGLPERRRRDRRHVIQLVSQDPLSSLNPRHTVHAAIAESLGARRLHTRRLELEIGEALSGVGLSPELLGRYPRQLSGGQRQRVAIARALARRPELLVCDEPVSALDVRTQAQILALLKSVSAARGMAIVFISHDLAVVREMCERVLVLKDGAVVEEGDIEQIFRSPAHPYTAELVASMPVLELARDELAGDLGTALAAGDTGTTLEVT